MTRRILVVDDEDHIREVAATSLEALGGWQVLTAECGREALVQAKYEQPDAILLDVMMPGMDGITALGELKADPATSHIPVVLLTAKAQSGDRSRFRDLGIKAITKPFDPVALPGDLAALLGWA